MNASAVEIREGRTAVEHILDELGLRAFVFTLEPKEGGWELHLDCSMEEGWQSITLPADIGELRTSLGDPAVRERLREDWRARLRACASSRGA